MLLAWIIYEMNSCMAVGGLPPWLGAAIGILALVVVLYIFLKAMKLINTLIFSGFFILGIIIFITWLFSR